MHGIPMSRVAPGGRREASVRAREGELVGGVCVVVVMVSVLVRPVRVSSSSSGGVTMGSVSCASMGTSGAVNTVCRAVSVSSVSVGVGVLSFSWSTSVLGLAISTRPIRGEGPGEDF